MAIFVHDSSTTDVPKAPMKGFFGPSKISQILDYCARNTKTLAALVSLIGGVSRRLHELEQKMTDNTQAINDLKAADVKLTAEVALIVPAIADLKAKVAALQAAVDADDNVSAAIEAEVKNVTDATDALSSALPAAPAPAPADPSA